MSVGKQIPGEPTFHNSVYDIFSFRPDISFDNSLAFGLLLYLVEGHWVCRKASMGLDFITSCVLRIITKYSFHVIYHIINGPTSKGGDMFWHMIWFKGLGITLEIIVIADGLHLSAANVRCTSHEYFMWHSKILLLLKSLNIMWSHLIILECRKIN